MKRILSLCIIGLSSLCVSAQIAKVYNEKRDPIAQIDSALNVAKETKRHVICQVGGNWCRWCLMFADFITKDNELSQFIKENYVYEHINYTRLQDPGSKRVAERLKNPGRFGFPVFVVLDSQGNILHYQDSSFLEQGEGYDKDKVLRFLKNWTPNAVKPLEEQ